MSENPKLVNLGGVVPNLPAVPNIPDYPIDASGTRGLSLSEAYQQGLAGPGSKAAGPIPASSFYIGERYPATRPFTDFEEMAANNQSTLEKWRNGITKMAGTTTNAFAAGTVGLLYGAYASLRDQRFASLFDNELNRGLDEVLNKQLEDVAPNYYTKKEKDADWWEPDNVLTANFWSDKVAKNLGYTLGSIAGGFGWSALFKSMGVGNALIKAGQGLTTVEAVDAAIVNAPKMSRFGAVNEALTSLSQKYIKNPIGQTLSQADRITTSFMGTMGEASIESLQSTNEFRNKLIDEYIRENGAKPEGDDLKEINSYADKVGNYVWGANVALLTATNYIQLPKILNSSRKTERSLLNNIEREGDVLSNWTAPKLGIIGKAYTGISNLARVAFSAPEAFEEGMQYAVQKGVEDYFSKAYKNRADINSFFSTLGNVYANITDEGIYRALNDKEGLESILIGGLSGGIMTARSSLKERGLLGTGGQMGRNTATAVNALNQTKIDKTLKDLSRYATIGVNAQQERFEALVNNDVLQEKDAEKDYALSYLMPRVKYGKLEALRQELGYYRSQANNMAGFEELKNQGIANPNDTPQTFTARLDALEAEAVKMNSLYDTLNDKYSNIRNEKGERVYSDLVIDKLVYATAKIADYDKRLVELGAKLTTEGMDVSFVKPSIGDKEALVQGMEKTIADIDAMDVVDEVKENSKNNLYSYVQMALLRKNFIEQYNAIKNEPEKYSEPEPDLDREPTDEEKEAAAKGEQLPEKFVEIQTKRGKRKVYIGQTYLVGRVVDYDDNKKEVYRAPEITVIGENEDGTLKIKTSDGEIKDINKKILENYNLTTREVMNRTTTSRYYYNHWNDVFVFNFGKDKGGKRQGRIVYDAEKDNLFFVYKDARGEPKEKQLARKHFVAQEGFTEPLIKPIKTLEATTTAKQKAEQEFLAQEEMDREARELIEERKKDSRLAMIKEITDQTQESLEQARKNLTEKQAQLTKINEDLEALREQKITAPSAKRAGKFISNVKFAKVFNKTSEAIIKLSKLRENVEKQVNWLTADVEELEFNLSYLQDFAQNIDELPTDTREFVKELRDQINWLDELVYESKQEINVLAQMGKEIEKAIKEFTQFLKDVFEKFNKDYPSYLKDAFERMIEGKGILSEIDIVERYKTDKQLLGDTEKEIAINRERLDELDKEIQTIAGTMKELIKQVNAKELIAKRFEEELAIYDRNKAEEEALQKDEALRAKFFNDQKSSQAFSGEEVEGPQSEEDIEKQEAAMAKFIAAKPIEIAFASTVVSSSSDRPSDARFLRFLEKMGKFDTEKLRNLRRIFVAKGNQKALGLENEEEQGIVETHLRGFEPKTADDQQILAVFVIQDGNSFYYINEDGEKLAKVGERVDDFSEMIWASMPRPTEETDAGYSRFNEKASDAERKAYIDAYKKWRADVLAQTDTIYDPEAFYLSQGITKKSKKKNYIIGSIVTREELESGKPVVVVSTKGVIVHNGVDVTAPKGFTYIQNGNILERVYNRNLTEKEATTVFEVLKEFVRKANKQKGFDKLMTKYLQGVLYFSSPYRKQDDDSEVKGRVGRNQFYYRKGHFYFGEKEVEIPFTVDGLEINKEDVMAFLKGTYNNINTYLLNQNEPFTEFKLNEQGALETKEWNSYQEYLISDEGRSAEEVPLTTTVVTPSNDVPGDTIYQSGSLYTYSFNLFNVDLSSIERTPPKSEEQLDEENGDKEMTEEEFIKANNIKPETPVGRRLIQIWRDKQKALRDSKKAPAPAAKAAPAKTAAAPAAAISTEVGELTPEEKDYVTQNKINVNTPIGKQILLAFRRKNAGSNVQESPKPQAPATSPINNVVLRTDKQGEEDYEELERVSVADMFKQKETGQKEKIEQPEPTKTKTNLSALREKFSKPDGYDDQQYRVVGAYNYVMANVEEEAEYIKKNSPFSVTIIDNLIAAGNGLYAWGSYKDAAVTLSRLMEVGTGYHEFFEGVFDVFLNNTEKDRILKEFISRKGTFVDRETGKTVAYKDATVRQAKEQIAEEFRDKKLYDRNPPKTDTNFIVKFFQDLIKFIDSILNGNIKSIDDLFAKMDGGYYKNAPFKKAPTTQAQYRLETIGTLDAASTSVVVKHVVSKIFRRLFTGGRTDIINTLDFSDFRVQEVYKQVYNDMGYYYTTQLPELLKKQTGMTDEQYDTVYGPVVSSVLGNWDTVQALTKEFLKTFNILQSLENEKETENSDYGGRNADSYLNDTFLYDGKKNAPASIKLLIATLNDTTWLASKQGQIKISDLNTKEFKERELIKDSVTQLNKMVDYARMFNYTLGQLVEANTMKEKEAIIKKLAYTNPNFVELVDFLKIDKPVQSTDEWSLKVKWYNTFSKQRPVGLINYIQSDGTVTIGDANLRNALEALLYNWLSNAKNNTNLTRVEKNKFFLSFNKVLRDTNTPEKRFKFLSDIGITFEPSQIANLSQEDMDNIAEAINSIKTENAKGRFDATTFSSLGLRGPFETIFSIYIKSKNIEPEATSLNINNQRIQDFIQTNAVSRIINDINNASSVEDLLRRLPYLSSEYSQDSVFINEVKFPNNVKSDVKLKLLYVQGTVDTTDNDAIETSRLTEAQSLMQGLNQNLAGNYYVMLPGDGQTEYMVNLSNRYEGLTKEAVSALFNYYQTEQAMEGKSRNRQFNFLKDDITEEETFKKDITKFVEQEVQGQMKTLMDSGALVQFEEEGSVRYAWSGLYRSYVTKNSYDISSLTEEQVKEILTYRTVNFIANNTEIHKLFFGDPAAYQDAVNGAKRYKSFLSPREQSVYDSPEYNAFANETFNKAGDIRLKPTDPGYQRFSDSMKTATIKDNYVTVTELPGYEEVNSSDGQGISTLPAAMQMLMKNGDRVTEGMKKQFQYDMALDRFNMEEDGFYEYKDEALRDHDVKLIAKGNPRSGKVSPLKPVVSGFDGSNPILDKYSIYPMTYTAVRGTSLAKVYLRMLENKMDYIIFESGRKVGASKEESLDSMYDENGNVKTGPFSSSSIVNVPFKWFGLQVETQTSKSLQPIGSQLSKLATVNLMEYSKPRDYKGTIEQWDRLSYEERKKQSKIFTLVAKERELRAEMINEGYNQLIKKLGITSSSQTFSVKKLLDLIRDETTRRGINDNLREALNIDPNTKDFLIPLEALNNYEAVKSLIYSYVNKFIASPRVNGGGYVQASGAGWEIDGQRVKQKEYTTKDGKKRTIYTHAGLKFYTKEDPYMEVYLPFWASQKLVDAGVDLANFKITDLDEEILKGIGFRIPTQELNSVEVFRVKGFLPESMGNMVVVPEAITTKAGSDFDVDKLFTYLKNVYVNRNGKVKMVPYFGIGDSAKNKLAVLDFVESSVKPKADAIESLTAEDFDISDEFPAIDKLYKQSLENEYFKTLEEILTLPENFDRLVTPNSSDELKALRKELVEISEEEFGEGINKTTLSPNFMNKTRHKFLTGKGGVGVGATNQVNAALVQKANVYIDPDRVEKLTDVKEVQFLGGATVNLPSNTVEVKGKKYPSLSGVFDVTDRYITDKISQYINGFVDVSKDAFLMVLGVTRRNSNTFILLERLGVPSDVVVFFMNQPIIREYNKILERQGKTYLFEDKMLELIHEQFPNRKTLSEYPTTDSKQLAALLKKNISDYYKDGKKTLTQDQVDLQRFILNEYLKYSVMANNLYRFSQAINYDTSNISSPWLVDRKLTLTEDAQQNNIFSSVNEVLDSTYMGDMKDAIVKATDTISDTFFMFLNSDNKAYVDQITKELSLRRGLNEDDFLKVARKVEQSFIAYLSQNKSKLNQRIKALAVNASTAVATQVQDIKTQLASAPNSDLARNPIIQRLTTENIKEDTSTRVVKLFDKSTDVFTQNTLIEAMQELKNNETTRDLYGNLVRIGFIQSGIATSPISFLDIVPVEDYKNLIIPAIEALTDKDLLLKFNSVGDFQRNNWRDTDAVPRIKEVWVKVTKGPYAGQWVVPNRFYNRSLTKLAESVGIDNLYAYTVFSTDSRAKSRYLTIRTGKGNASKIVLLRRVDLVEDSEPYITLDRKGNTYAVYVQINAWGDGINGQEHYLEPRRSVYNNGTVQTDVELSNEQILEALLGNQTTVEEVQEKPASPTFEESFTEERQKEIIKNFADKHKLTEQEAIRSIRDAIAVNGQEAIDKIKECY